MIKERFEFQKFNFKSYQYVKCDQQLVILNQQLLNLKLNGLDLWFQLGALVQGHGAGNDGP